jgi:hypothetical protein
MKSSIIHFSAAALLLGMLAGCQKKREPIDTFDVKVEYAASNAKAITGDVSVNPKDSIFLAFTVTSLNDMSFIEIQKNGVRVDTFQVPAGSSRSFTRVKGYQSDSIPGDYTWRVLARDSKAVFMGDGGKRLKVTVNPDFDFWSYRIMAVPDTTEKKNKCYYSTKDGKIYSYSEAASKSASIDFGYYYDTTATQRHCFYALTAAQPQLGFYDIASWTKNATVLKKLPSSVNFVSQLTSGGALRTLVGGNLNAGTLTKVPLVATTGGNNVIGFRTASGKFGAILVRFISGDSPAKGTTIEVDVKVQK